MNNLIALYTLLLIFLISPAILFSQSSLTTVSNATEIIANKGKELALTNPDDDQWTYFLNAEKKSYFIDFESISVNLTEILIKNKVGDTIYRDDVFDLPVDTIYEIDLSGFSPGNYTIEVKSFIQSTTKSFTLN